MNVYSIKKGKSWTRVKATSMKALNNFCNENGFTDWRTEGMRSLSQMKQDENLQIIGE